MKKLTVPEKCKTFMAIEENNLESVFDGFGGGPLKFKFPSPEKDLKLLHPQYLGLAQLAHNVEGYFGVTLQ